MAIKLADLKVGDTITIKDGALDYNTKGKYQSWVYGYKFQIIQVGKSTDKEYIVFGINGAVTGAVKYTSIATHKSKGGASKPNTKTSDKPKPKKKNTSVPDTKDTTSATTKDKDKQAAPVANPSPSAGSYVNAGDGRTAATAYTAVGADSYQSKGLPTDEEKGNVLTPTSIHRGNYNDEPRYIRPSDSTYPKLVGIDGTNGYRRIYDYATDTSYAKSKLSNIHEKHNIFTTDRVNVYNVLTQYYNRFKIQNPNTSLTSSFAHIFFTRPDLNILLRTGPKQFELTDSAAADPEIFAAYHSNPDMIKQLVLDNGMDHKFMFSLSNAAGSFSTADEGLKTDTAGETWTGQKIAYGKHNIDGRTASQFQITFTDNRNLDVYHINKLWMDYISKVYRGQLRSKGQVYNKKTGMWEDSVYNKTTGSAVSYIEDKILDYAVSVYYILCAEDGETIIFWSKYFGVFPVNSPSSSFSWSSGSKLHNPQLDIPYMYSFKRDYNPFDLVAFNKLSAGPSGKDANGNAFYKYSKIYDPEIMGAGRTLVGAPFIETISDPAKKSEAYQFKLRFRTRGADGNMYTT